MLKWPHLLHGLAFETRRLRQLEAHVFAYKLLSHTVCNLIWFALLPLASIGHAAGYRRATIFTDRIGHFALEIDCLLKAQKLGDIPKRRYFILAPDKRTANQHLRQCWQALIPIYTNQVGCFLLGCLSLRWLMRYDVSHYLLAPHHAQEAYRIHARWQGRSALLQLDSDDEIWGQAKLQELGIPETAWFVCVHAREAGFSPVDEALHSHRNSNIEITIPAMQEIVQRGGWIIRIGDPTMRPLPSTPHIIDYAHHSLKSDRLDVILCAKARFILGNSSGIALVGTVFNVPCAIANMIPTPDLWFSAKDISIPKRLWSTKVECYLHLEEAMAHPIGALRYASLFHSHGIRVDENSEEEIRDLAIEMLDRLEGKFIDTEEDKNRWNLLYGILNEQYYSHKSAARFSTLFIRRHFNNSPN
ncbi:MAG: hypothetical protein JWL63_529 [Rhodocyclales bacterium]|nr:hypothetical protein [Rhodocyclales bacterium]